MGKTLKYVKEFDFGPQRTHVRGYCRGGPMKKATGGQVTGPAATSRPPSPLGAMAARPPVVSAPKGDTHASSYAQNSAAQGPMQKQGTAATYKGEPRVAAQAAQQRAAQAAASQREGYANPRQQTDADRAAMDARSAVRLKSGGKVSAPAFNSRPKVGGSCKW